VRAVEGVGRGEAPLDPTLTPKVLQRVRGGEHSRAEAAFRVLTERELEILARVAEGKTNREIAQELFLSHKTVRNYMSTVLQKLGIANRTEAAAYAIRHHLHEYLSKD
ncbi:two-component system, NarL family, response regulator LiaR, partial [Candidatus Hakubella thermalkaliphila]